ncbi:hypothetical protein HQ531_03485 [bacterium]|nr:hypothetical protein [bacterium]
MKRDLKQNTRIWTAKSKAGLNENQFRLMVLDANGGVSRSTRDLTYVQAEILIQALERMPRKHIRKSKSPYASRGMKAQVMRLGNQYPWKTSGGFSLFLSNRFGIEDLNARVDRKKCNAAIEALKQMTIRISNV